MPLNKKTVETEEVCLVKMKTTKQGKFLRSIEYFQDKLKDIMRKLTF